MSKHERVCLEVLGQVRRKELTRAAAASALAMSERQVYRLLSRTAALGDAGVVHGLRGRASNHGHVLSDRSEVIRLYKQREYKDYGPQLFMEVLSEYHGITVSRETIRRWLKAEGLWAGQRAPRRHRKKRPRREGIGMLVQFDGSPHDWFEGRGGDALAQCCLLVAIDDASSRIFMRFAPTEDTAHVMRALWMYMERYGIPQALYTDRGPVYGKKEEEMTQTARALKQLGVQLIRANSPQAKGRVERSNRTHQDRLIKAMRHEGISSIEAANAYLEREYLAKHNAKFAVTEGKADVHRTTRGIDFANIFCIEEERNVCNDYTIQLGGQFIQLERGETPLPPPRTHVTVRTWLDGSLHISWKENELAYTRLEEKPKGPGRQPTIPAADHPFRRHFGGVKRVVIAPPLNAPATSQNR